MTQDLSPHSSHSFFPLLKIVFSGELCVHDIIQRPQQLMRAISYCPRITAEGAEAQRGSRTGLDPHWGVIPPLGGLWL